MNTTKIQSNITRIETDINRMAKFIDQSKPGWTRRPFTKWYDKSREWLKQEMNKCGLDVRIDAASNLIGRLEGTVPGLAPIMIGSHTDTVNAGGRFDGIVGVIAGIEIVRLLKEGGIQLRHPLEIVDFTAEEPSEFGISTIGSRGLVNNLTEEMLNREDSTGLILKDAIKRIGGEPSLIGQQALKKGDIALYLELHIEQGPVLDQTNHKLGVVTGIVGIHRYRVTIEGKPNHAGTTPMNMRCDALVAAAELVLRLETLCKKTYTEEVVGTVGKLTLEPNASNVIPGKVVFDMEVRSLNINIVNRLFMDFLEYAKEVEVERTISIEIDCLSKSKSIIVEKHILDVIEKSCQQTAPTKNLPSGAGHDANQLAEVSPIGMIFIPSVEGRSHCPEEWTDFSDISTGIEAMTRSLLLFDESL